MIHLYDKMNHFKWLMQNASNANTNYCVQLCLIHSHIFLLLTILTKFHKFISLISCVLQTLELNLQYEEFYKYSLFLIKFLILFFYGCLLCEMNVKQFVIKTWVRRVLACHFCWDCLGNHATTKQKYFSKWSDQLA